MSDPVLTDGDLSLRPYTQEDHQRTFVWLQDPATRRMTGTTRAPTPEAHAQWLSRNAARTDMELYAIEYQGEHIGNAFIADIDHENRHATPQMYLGPVELRGKGIGKRAMALMIRRAFQGLRIHRFWGCLFEYNAASLGMLKANGYQVEGVLRDHRIVDGAYCNMLMVSVLNPDV